MRLTVSERIIEAIEGATIVSGRIDDGEGLCLDLADGRTLIIAVAFALSLMRIETARLH
jgi:hypothetical protein